jgi:hypothetical protein
MIDPTPSHIETRADQAGLLAESRSERNTEQADLDVTSRRRPVSALARAKKDFTGRGGLRLPASP